MDDIENVNSLGQGSRAHGAAGVRSGVRVFPPEAVAFLKRALVETVRRLGRHAPDLAEEERHVTGGELLEGIRLLGEELYGRLAPVVFAQWSVHRTDDWGEIVFALVESGSLRKTERDSRSDFAHGYDFKTAFCAGDYWRRIELPECTLPDWDPEDMG